MSKGAGFSYLFSEKYLQEILIMFATYGSWMLFLLLLVDSS